MRHSKGKDLNIADYERHSGLNGDDLRIIQFVLFGLHCANRSRREKCFDRQFLQKRLQSAGMIGMFVRDQHGIDSVGILADGFQPFCDFFSAHSGIDQQTDAVRLDESRISSASASQTRTRLSP